LTTRMDLFAIPNLAALMDTDLNEFVILWLENWSTRKASPSSMSSYLSTVESIDDTAFRELLAIVFLMNNDGFL